ncbi:MAG: SGNH/GDSL hydrolase family protein [Alphaproteobacteria bacterium]
MAKDRRTARRRRRDRGALAGQALLGQALFVQALFGLALLGLTALGGGAFAAQPQADRTPIDQQCAVPDVSLSVGAPMAAAVQALRDGGDLEIVALGSSSTEGTGATSPELSYPARLAEELRLRFPGARITIINRGVGGQLARHMVDRLARDAIDVKPQLVIWQTGTNDALALVDIADFKATLAEGVARLKRAGIDVMLMDLQYYPNAVKVAAYEHYVEAMSGVAREAEVGLFARYAMMQHWAAADRDLWAGDRFHLGNLGYHCVAAVLAEALERQVDESRLAAAPAVGTAIPAALAVAR